MVDDISYIIIQLKWLMLIIGDVIELKGLGTIIWQWKVIYDHYSIYYHYDNYANYRYDHNIIWLNYNDLAATSLEWW